MVYINAICMVFFVITALSAKEFTNIRFHKTNETLERIEEIVRNKQKGAYFRFGDGDTNVATGVCIYDCSDQPKSIPFELEMQEAFSLDGPTILKTLPLYCPEFNGWEEGMFPGNHGCDYGWALDQINKANRYWDIQPGEKIYSHVALHFSATQFPDRCIQFLKFLKQSNCCLFVGDDRVQKLVQLLFGEHCKIIPTPSSQAYFSIDQIERECLEKVKENNDYQIIVTAMGCAGRVLQKRLWKKLDNVFLFDFGSLIDALSKIHSRDWITLTRFNSDEFLKKLSE